MLIKNAIVLVEQINLELPLGKSLITAIIDASASRLRPVSMAALTTALGMIPLIFDAFFSSMAVLSIVTVQPPWFRAPRAPGKLPPTGCLLGAALTSTIRQK